MPIALRHRADPTPQLAVLPGFAVTIATQPAVIAALQQKSLEDMTRRFSAGHRVYVAWHAGEPAAWGWVATSTAQIGELASTITIPSGQRYLWNFVTRPSHRGLGIYPRLLDAIVRSESRHAERFWVAYAPENHASGAGIRKAGFVDIAELSFDATGRPAVSDIVQGGARSASRFLGVPVAEETLARCWRCAKAAAPGTASCHAGPCSCDYQRPVVACA
jgi:GNAT superfamily N-acetyltransferase